MSQSSFVWLKGDIPWVKKIKPRPELPSEIQITKKGTNLTINVLDPLQHLRIEASHSNRHLTEQDEARRINSFKKTLTLIQNSIKTPSKFTLEDWKQLKVPFQRKHPVMAYCDSHLPKELNEEIKSALKTNFKFRDKYAKCHHPGRIEIVTSTTKNFALDMRKSFLQIKRSGYWGFKPTKDRVTHIALYFQASFTVTQEHVDKMTKVKYCPILLNRKRVYGQNYKNDWILKPGKYVTNLWSYDVKWLKKELNIELDHPGFVTFFEPDTKLGNWFYQKLQNPVNPLEYEIVKKLYQIWTNYQHTLKKPAYHPSALMHCIQRHVVWQAAVSTGAHSIIADAIYFDNEEHRKFAFDVLNNNSCFPLQHVTWAYKDK